MHALLLATEIHSEEGTAGAPSFLKLELNGKEQICPVNFRRADGKIVFSLGADEITPFCEALKKMDCNA